MIAGSFPAGRVGPLPGADPHAECAEEPIATPGEIQPHGALLALDGAGLRVEQASATLGAVLGLDAASALGQPPAALIGEAGWRAVQAMLDRGPGSAVEAALRLPTLPGAAARAVAATVTRSRCGRICIELEPVSDQRGRGPSGSRLVPVAQSVLAILRGARGTAELVAAAAREMRRLTGHDRAMLYRFDAEGHGEVVAEDALPGLEPYLGLRYPASDIPAQARRLYLAQRVRVIADVAYAPAPMLRLPGSAALDMTHCALRSVSPVHREYLTNMGVRSTAVASLAGVQGDLWGLLVCHGGTPHPMTPEQRAMLDLMAQVIAVLLASIGEAEAMAAQLEREQRLRAVAAALACVDRPLAAALGDAGAHLLAAAGAEGAVLRVEGRLACLGAAPAPDAAAALLDALLARADGALPTRADGALPTRADGALPAHADGALLETDHLAALLPEAASLAPAAAGALLQPLPQASGDALLWLRPERTRLVRWGGDPHAAPTRDAATGRLSPRRSFAAWREEVRGRAEPWSDADRAAAREARRLIGDAFLRRAEAELARLRHTDPLTGLANRRLMQERLDELSPGTPAALVYVDLDRFKDVNDSLGHDAGDALLVQIAARLRSALAATPETLVARIGGDEFALLAENAGVEEGERLAAILRAALEPAFDLVGRPYRATASVGLAHSSAAGHRGAALLQAADAAMYVAKRGGGDAAARYSEPVRAAVAQRFAVEQELRAALHAGGDGLLLHFQPVVNLDTGELRGFEALLRWRHPARGLVPPGEFIGIAEATGLIAPLGEWVMEAALDRLAAWRAGGQAGGSLPRIGVNVSPRQLAAGDFAGRILAGLARRGLPPHLLHVEVTEAAMAEAAALRALAALREAGVQVAIDDFGTGYSSLSHLARLPADTAKLDRSFLPAADQDPAAAARQEAFMAAAVSLARRAGMRVVVEGVETAAQLLAVAAAGADSVQGFLIGRPMPEAEAAALLGRLARGAPAPWDGLVGPLGPLARDAARETTGSLAMRDILQAITDPILVTDAGTAPGGPRILFANAAFETLCGHRSEELVGRSPRLLQGPGTDRRATLALGAALRRGAAAKARLLNYRRDGSPYLVDLRILPLRDPAGSPTHYVAIQRLAEDGPQRVEALAEDAASAVAALHGAFAAE